MGELFCPILSIWCKKKKPRGKNATLCPVTPYFSFPNFVMTYLICCAFSHKRRKKSLEKKKLNGKKSSRFPPLPIFSDSELSPTYPSPSFSTKSKNIQLRNTTRKRDEAEAWKKQKYETCIKTASSAASAHEISKVVPKTYYLHTLDKNDDFSHEKLRKHKPDINVEISSSLTCRKKK